uniref:Uncharacterized protein n=1 Tax=Canis lupus dingo TaxID=286419 RepID=A0A8C0QV65_CANLU
MTTASPWQVRPDYQQDSEAAANRQISLELYATYVYLSTNQCLLVTAALYGSLWFPIFVYC